MNHAAGDLSSVERQRNERRTAGLVQHMIAAPSMGRSPRRPNRGNDRGTQESHDVGTGGARDDENIVQDVVDARR